jgi:two-component system, NarL family, nitrate/nitrite response regulator NarL
VALRCLIVDDQTGFCEAARDLLESQGITVVGCASSIDDALSSIGALQPDVVLVDIDLGSESGFDLTQRIDGDPSAPQVILTSTHDEREFHKLIESSPAVGFLAKTELSAARISGLFEAKR